MYQFGKRKGQSAIEYLMTYGWMLLVVAIVGGAVITTVQKNQSQCKGEIPTELQAAQQGFGVSNFGIGGGEAQVVLTNNAQEEVTVSDVKIAGYDATAGTNTLGLGDEVTFSTSSGGAFSNSDSCTSINVEITYSQGGITGQVMNGSIRVKASVS